MATVMDAGIGLGLHFIAVHELTYYRKHLGDLRAALPVATDASQRIFSLPLFPGLTDSDQDDAIEAVRTVLARFAR